MDDSNKNKMWMNVIDNDDTPKLFTQIYSVFFFAFLLHALKFFLTFGSVSTNSTKIYNLDPSQSLTITFSLLFFCPFPHCLY